MQKITGKYGEAVVYSDNIESGATAQLFDLMNTKMVENETVKVMPDVHSGKGCIVGYTQTYSGGPLDPDVVGCDIGCKISSITYKYTKPIDLALIDQRIRKTIPLGMEINEKSVVPEKEFKKFLRIKLERARSLWPEFVNYEGLGEIENLITKTCKRIGMNEATFWKSLGTLGGGNHFIELGKDEENTITLTIHCGSRNLGVKILAYWKKQIGKTRVLKDKLKIEERNIKDVFKGNSKKIKEEIDKLHKSGKYTIPPSRFLTIHEDISGYLQDMFFAQAYAEYNHILISSRIAQVCGFGKELDRIESVHNYIDPHDKIIRKGSISAREGEKVIIPMNMSYGILICEGLGNSDWNYSAPHGAGRLMSRKEARNTISLEEFRESMNGIFSTSICNSCIDESPGAYKNPSEIIELIEGVCIKVLKTIKPLLSIKAGINEEN